MGKKVSIRKGKKENKTIQYRSKIMRRSTKIQLISLVVLLFAGMPFFPVQAQDLFYPCESIPTHGANDWKSFTIGTDTFLAVANTYNDSTYNIDSKIYKWDGSSFVEIQSIPTHGAADWESFTIGTETFLAVANYYNDSTYNIDSKIYKWNGISFEWVQSIPTHGAADWESFTIGTDTFLAVANHYNGSTYDIHSEIYKWNGNSFVWVQSIPTRGALDWESFTVGNGTYLAVANFRDGATYNIDSKMYEWNGSLFVGVQSVPTHGANGWESFTINNEVFLAVANYYDGSTYNINSEIYRKEAPTADAGEDQIVYDSVTLDGSASFDEDGGQIVSWEWALVHQTNPECNLNASGEIVTVEDLAPGFYHVTLTVTDNDGLSGTDEMILAAIGCKGDFDGDGVVDGSDLAAFAVNFGRTDCPVCE